MHKLIVVYFSNNIKFSLSFRMYIEDKIGRHTMAVYCKNPKGCDGMVLLEDDMDSSKVTCFICNFSFCAFCDLPAHEPAPC